MYETLPDGKRRCPKHDVIYEKIRSCHACDLDPTVSIDAIAPITTDKELQLIEDELRAEARYYRKLGRELCDSGGRDVQHGLKAAEVSLKFDRAYKELVQQRKEREHDRWLVDENRKLQGNGVAH